MFSIKQWLRRLQTAVAGTARRPSQSPWRIHTRLELEQLEYRVVPAAPTAIFVDPNYTAGSAGGHTFGVDAFNTITAGLNAVASNGTVNIDDGTYNESVNTSSAGNSKVTLSLTGTHVSGAQTPMTGLVEITGDLTLSATSADSITLGSNILQLDGTLTQNAGAITDNGQGALLLEGGATQTAGTVGVNFVQLGPNSSGNFNLASPNQIGTLYAPNIGALSLNNARNLSLENITAASDVSITDTAGLIVFQPITAGGNVTLQGNGGSGQTFADGVGIDANVTAGGNLNITGVGSAGPGVSIGGATVESVSGSVFVQGTGGTEGQLVTTPGVVLQAGATITAAGSGSVTVIGHAGTSNGPLAGSGIGVWLLSSFVTSSGGNVSVTGTGGSGAFGGNAGVELDRGSEITAGGTGTVMVNGTGGVVNGAADGDNYGVFLNSASQAPSGGNGNGSFGLIGPGGSGGGFVAISTITSSGGNISVTGTGGGASAPGQPIGTTDTEGHNYGVYVANGSSITKAGTGTVTVTGTGGMDQGNFNYGVYVSGDAIFPTIQPSQIDPTQGILTVTGTGGGTGASTGNSGVVADNLGEFTSDTGDISLSGTAGHNSSVAIDLSNGGAVRTAGGLQLLGTGAFLLTSGGNHVGTLAADVAGSLSYADDAGFDIGSVNGTDGISTGTGNTLALTAGDAVTQTQPIASTIVELVGTAPAASYTLNNADNAVANLGAQLTGGSLSFMTLGDLNVTGVTTGVTTGTPTVPGGNVNLTAANRLTVSGDITTASGTGGTTTPPRGDVVIKTNVAVTPGAGNIVLQGALISTPPAALGTFSSDLETGVQQGQITAAAATPLMRGIRWLKKSEPAGNLGKILQHANHLSKQIVRLYKSGKMAIHWEATLLSDMHVIKISFVHARKPQIDHVFDTIDVVATNQLMANPAGVAWAAVSRYLPLETKLIRASELAGEGKFAPAEKVVDGMIKQVQALANTGVLDAQDAAATLQVIAGFLQTLQG
jgi:hypothetical protein